jgi:hypothetical protein
MRSGRIDETQLSGKVLSVRSFVLGRTITDTFIFRMLSFAFVLRSLLNIPELCYPESNPLTKELGLCL